MPDRIVILTGSSLCHNPRVYKEATALTAAGFEVEVLGAWMNAELKARDLVLLENASFRFLAVLDVTSDKFHWLYRRIQVKAARLWHKWTGWESRGQLGYTSDALLHRARRDAALYIAHSEPAMWSAVQLQNRGYQVGVDMEDWFSDDLLADVRKTRPQKLLKNLEAQLLRKSRHTSCPSNAMSQALAREYGCPPPVEIYNTFPWSDRLGLDGLVKDRRDPSLPSIHWYSQTLGAGRGLEDLFGALADVRFPAEIHLRGHTTNEFHQWIARQVPAVWRPRIFVHDLVANDELLSRIAEHDIGFAGEMKEALSRDLTISNKILHYLLGGLAVIASNTAGQKEVAAQANGAVVLYESGNPLDLARQLNELLGSPEKIQAGKVAALVAAEQTFCWEKSAPHLVRSITAALAAAREAKQSRGI